MLLALFAVVERRAPEPILPFEVLRNPIVAGSVACMALVGMAMFGTISYVPLFVQGVIGTSATSSGVVLTPLMLGAVDDVAPHRPAHLAHRPLPLERGARPARPDRRDGAALADGRDTTNGQAARKMVVAGIGIGSMMQVFVLSVQNAVPRARIGSATALTQFARQMGATIGVTIMGVIVNHGLPPGVAAAARASAIHRLPPALAQRPRRGAPPGVPRRRVRRGRRVGHRGRLRQGAAAAAVARRGRRGRGRGRYAGGGCPRITYVSEDFMPLDGWDHVELWVGNAKQAAYYYEHAFGFRCTAYAGPETGVRDRASYVLEQSEIRLVVSSSLRRGHEIGEFACLHGDGVKDISLRVPDANEAYRQAVQRGARGIMRAEGGRGRVRQGRARDDRDLRRRRPHVRRPARLRRRVPARGTSPRAVRRTRGVGLLALDHIVGNVELGRMQHWVEFYERVFGMTEMIHFSDEDISTEYSALMSKVMTDGQGKVKFPINEPAEGKRKSQIEEYLEFNHGPGVTAHRDAVGEHRRDGRGDATPRRACSSRRPTPTTTRRRSRVGEIDESWDDLRRLRILADRDDDGYLLQIFTKTAQDRPTLFFEVIERHGARGFGDGNFKALFEAIEREQALRGNL